MDFIKKVIIIILSSFLFLFFCLPAYAKLNNLHEKSNIRETSPVARVLEEDMPEPPEPSWWDKYKWWIALGVVAVGGGAAAAAGGGGDDSSSDSGDNTNTQPTGKIGVTW